MNIREYQSINRGQLIQWRVHGAPHGMPACLTIWIKNKILHENQFGFRKGLSTCTALLQLVDELADSIDRKKVTVGVFIDLAKAFGTVDHRILLQKLEHYSFRGVVLNWFASYLANRKQFDTKSSSYKMRRATGFNFGDNYTYYLYK